MANKPVEEDWATKMAWLKSLNVLFDKSYSPSKKWCPDKNIIIYLLQYRWPQGISLSELSRNIGSDIRTVKKSIKRLTKEGYYLPLEIILPSPRRFNNYNDNQLELF